jgi:hypothetical protein
MTHNRTMRPKNCTLGQILEADDVSLAACLSILRSVDYRQIDIETPIKDVWHLLPGEARKAITSAFSSRR